MRILAPIMLLLALCSMSVGVGAHTGLSRSVPADGASLAASPARIVLTFSGQVRLFKLQLTDASGARIDLGPGSALAPASEFTVPVKHLAPGRYEVDWVVMGGDGHKMDGRFSFSIGDAGEASHPQ